MKRKLVIILCIVAICGIAYAIDTGTRGISMLNGNKPNTGVGEIWVGSGNMTFSDGSNTGITLAELAAGAAGTVLSTATAAGAHGTLQYNNEGIIGGDLSARLDDNTGSMLFGSNHTTDTHNYTFRAGNNNRTSDDYAAVIGAYNEAGNYAFAGGTSSSANGLGSFAFGNDCHTSGPYSFAVGKLSWAPYDYSAAIGYNARADNYNAVSIGFNSRANANPSFALGNGAIAGGGSSVAIGTTYSTGSQSVSIGYLNSTDGNAATALGYSNDVDGQYGVAIGSEARIKGAYSIGIGRAARVGGDNSVQISLNSVGATTETADNAMSIIGGNMAVGKVAPTSQFEVNQGTRLNVSAGDYDTIISSDHITNMLQVDASLDKVNIGGDVAITSATTIGETLGVTGLSTLTGGVKTATISVPATSLAVGSNATTVEIGQAGSATSINGTTIIDDDTTVTGNLDVTGKVSAAEFVGAFFTTSTITAGGDVDTTGTFTSRATGSNSFAGKLGLGATSSSLSNVLNVRSTDDDNIAYWETTGSQNLSQYKAEGSSNGFWFGVSGYGSGCATFLDGTKTNTNMRLTNSGELIIPRGGISVSNPDAFDWGHKQTEYAYYKFEDTISSVSKNLTDSSFHWNDPATSKTFSGITTAAEERTTTGLIGNGLLFDGVNDYVNLGADFGEDFLKANHDFTVSVWWNTDNTSFTAAGRRIMYKRVTSPANNGIDINQIHASGQDRINITAYAGGVTFTKILTNINDYLWHNFVLTRSGSTLTWYVDGAVSLQTTNAAFVGSMANGSNWFLGTLSAATGWGYGKMDNFRCYPYAVSASQVSTLYNSRAGTNNTLDVYSSYDSPMFNILNASGSLATSGTLEVDGRSDLTSVTATSNAKINGSAKVAGRCDMTTLTLSPASPSTNGFRNKGTSKFDGRIDALSSQTIGTNFKVKGTSHLVGAVDLEAALTVTGNGGITVTPSAGVSALSANYAYTPVMALGTGGSGFTGYVATFSNSVASSGSLAYQGIKIQSGMAAQTTTKDNNFIDVYDGDGGLVGYGYWDNGALAWNRVSDSRTKSGITTSTIVAADKIRALPMRQYWRRGDATSQTIQGFIAQEVLPVIPEAVTSHTDRKTSETTLLFSDTRLIPYLWQFARETERENRQLKKRINQLENKVDAIDTRLSALEASHP